MTELSVGRKKTSHCTTYGISVGWFESWLPLNGALCKEPTTGQTTKKEDKDLLPVVMMPRMRCDWTPCWFEKVAVEYAFAYVDPTVVLYREKRESTL